MEHIFALDIGTRKIVGLVMQRTEDKYVVIDSEMLEHKTRAMIDGQIHDVEAVANTIKNIKSTLEKRLNIMLENGAVAAAGRSLKMATASISKKREIINEITKEEVLALEIEAVGKAQYKLAEQDKNNKINGEYFCVGYSVKSYYLNEQKITNLVGQIGENIAVEVIATFLPQVVVDSLFSSLKKANLDVYSLTLEPIAALSIAIPPNMRLLNLSLVDIGAGTADIAIVKDGNIYAYAMVPMGGDILTEFIAGQYLLDFITAENLKRQLGELDTVEFTDILGNKHNIKSAQIIEETEVITTELVNNIAQIILELNQKTPDAVILVGGGSLTPNLPKKLAESLNIPANRVGFRSIDSMENLIINSDFLKGPQGMTPLGIAYNSFITNKVPFIKVQVNNKEVALWNQGELTVAQAILNSGISLNNIYGKPGLGKTIKINGIVKSFKGEVGILPIIKVNGVQSLLTDIIKDGDIIEFIKGEDGVDATVKLEDILPANSTNYVYVNGEEIRLEPVVFINGQMARANEEIPDRAVVEYNEVNSITNILLLHGVPSNYIKEKHYKYYLNGNLMFYKWLPVTVTVNDKKVTFDYTIKPNSHISYIYHGQNPKIKDVLHNVESWQITVDVNGEKITLPTYNAEVKCNGELIDINEPLYDGMKLEIDNTKNSAILSDIFKKIDIKPSSGRLNIIVDGETSGFTTPIYDGSRIELRWE